MKKLLLIALVALPLTSEAVCFKTFHASGYGINMKKAVEDLEDSANNICGGDLGAVVPGNHSLSQFQISSGVLAIKAGLSIFISSSFAQSSHRAATAVIPAALAACMSITASPI